MTQSILDLANAFHQETYVTGATAEEGGPHLSRGDHWRKYRSISMGCHPSQVREFNERARKAGLTGVRYLPNGTVECSSKGQQKKWCRHLGVVNGDSNS